MRHLNLCLVFYVAGIGMLLSGCSKDADTPKYRELKGRVAAIDQASGVVEMYYYNDKQKKEIRLSGKLAPDAEILINGATARLEDVQVDDSVAVTGRVEKHDGERQLVAVKVEVTRSETAETAAATKPAQ
jgi:hypothetical protein